MTRILVTGASGFIGRNTLRPLVAAGAELHASARSAPADGPDGVRWHEADLLDQDARRALLAEARPDTVLHLAWTTEHGRFWRAVDNLDWAAASLDLMRRAAEAGTRRVVMAGTCFEYAGDVAGDCNERQTRLAPVSLYAVAKDAVRRAAAAFAAEAGLGFAWARLFLLYGSGEAAARLVPSVAGRLIGGEPAPLSSGAAIRDFMESRDAGAALAALALSGVEGPVNVASGRAASVREVAEILARLAGRPDLLRIGALPDRDEPARLVADVTRLTEEVGFTSVRSLEEGLAEAMDNMRRDIAGATQQTGTIG